MIKNDVNKSSLWWKDICNLDLRGGELTYEHSVKETYKKIMSSFNISTDPSWSRA